MSEELRRVLLVNQDEGELAPLVEYLCQTNGYRIDVVNNDQNLLTHLGQRQGQYDVILLDEASLTASHQGSALKVSNIITYYISIY